MFDLQRKPVVTIEITQQIFTVKWIVGVIRTADQSHQRFVHDPVDIWFTRASLGQRQRCITGFIAEYQIGSDKDAEERQ